MSNQNKRKLLGNIPDIEKTKYEVAAELGVNIGPDATARENGKVGGYFGGKITKSLVEKALGQMPNE